MEFGYINEKINTLKKELAMTNREIEDGMIDETKQARRRALLSVLERWYDRKDSY